MTYSTYSSTYSDTSSTDALYHPSVIELAQAGNCQAIAYWMNSLLSAQGVAVQVRPADVRYYLKIFVDFQQPARKEVCMNLRDRLVRFICYRLWTLNSREIFGVRIVARMSGNSKVLWQQSVRINTPANSQRLRQMRTARLNQRQDSFRFQFLRSVLLSSVTLAGFYIGYRLLYVELSKALSKFFAAQPLATLAHLPERSQLSLMQAQISSSSQHDVITVPEQVPEQFQGKTVLQVAPVNQEKVMALTFDDGPWPETTEQVLDILKQNNIKATFFMVGLHIKRHPELAKRVAQEGHTIGNHTWSHPLEDVNLADAAYEIDGMEKLIHETTGVRAALFRPPSGQLNGRLATYARERKYATTLWSIDSEDHYVSSPILIDNVLKNAQPGRIVLMHDGGGDRSATIEALPQIISALRHQGYRFVTVPELMAIQAKDQESEADQGDRHQLS
ncbi:MAG: polysaccharide deacetylase family protein [Drouetiella hepatica Uher 2000/2452]|jgi:chitin deacetylase|uniref:Polysaccharide deacetylase family protein n=1 Tax=Drouetiella hepatica Uher 2000/2452 TaxID=904376 RepID=A0A951QI42_9CYAN|nr:polysaccharide deacetylase family protein [Drouetiella hepatica Uher 2000/2452]